MIPLGTKVKMSDKGCKTYPNHFANPHQIEGVVIEVERKKNNPFFLDCVVKWSNGASNTYNYEHLSPIIPHKTLEDYL